MAGRHRSVPCGACTKTSKWSLETYSSWILASSTFRSSSKPPRGGADQLGALGCPLPQHYQRCRAALGVGQGEVSNRCQVQWQCLLASALPQRGPSRLFKHLFLTELVSSHFVYFGNCFLHMFFTSVYNCFLHNSSRISEVFIFIRSITLLIITLDGSLFLWSVTFRFQSIQSAAGPRLPPTSPPWQRVPSANALSLWACESKRTPTRTSATTVASKSCGVGDQTWDDRSLWWINIPSQFLQRCVSNPDSTK